jgi:hypothetical protein
MKTKLVLLLLVFIFSFPLFFLYFFYLSKAAPVKANLVIDTQKTAGKFPDRFKALAQGGEEKGRMLGNVIDLVAGLYPQYIRIDHLYDFYDVVSLDSQNKIIFNWQKLDQTICDIYNVGAKPFLVLGYMPESLSADGSLVGQPKKWTDWSWLVQKTIERYSGKNTVLPCGSLSSFWKTDIYYEVWNEPDLETFGKWHYSGSKNYLELYFYAVKGAENAKNVYPFKIGGPATTALYKNWIQRFLDFVNKNNLRLDFLSWHHYSKNPEDFIDDMIALNKYLAYPQYYRFQNLPRILSEWGYDSNPNPIADTNLGAAYTIAAIRNFIGANYQLAFLFEIKDGLSQNWGIITNTGQPKPRYYALKLLNYLSDMRILVEGEGTYVKALASLSYNQINVILVNFDPEEKNMEMVPLTIKNLEDGRYRLKIIDVYGNENEEKIIVNGRLMRKNILLTANQIVLLQLNKD